MVTKKKEKKNADFKKVKLKVGKKLKKTATTDTTIHAKKLVLTSQLDEKADSEAKPLSFRGLSLDELCKQLGHFNKSIRKDALSGTKQLLSSRPDLIPVHLRTLIPSVARLLNESATDPDLNSLLKSLLSVICSVSEQAISPHFTLLLAHVLRALTNMEIGTRILAFSILSILMSNYPRLCRNSPDLFISFVKFLASPRKPKWNSPKFLENILSFLSVYDASSSSTLVSTIELSISFEKWEASSKVCLLDSTKPIGGGPFDFSVFSTAGSVCASPFELPENLIALSEALTPLVSISLMEDNGGAFLNPTLAIIESVGRAASNQSNSFLVPGFNQKLRDVWSQVKKAALARKSDRIRQTVSWLGQ